MGTARTIGFDAVSQGVDTHTDVYRVPADGRTLAVSAACAQGRDTADITTMLASLRPA